MVTLTWNKISRIPKILIREITYGDVYEVYDKSRKLLESDDLRIVIKLSGGHDLLCPIGSRLILHSNGDVSIEMLTETS